MPDWMRELLRRVIEEALGPGSIPSLESPREQILGAFINRLIFPKDFKEVMTLDYFTNVLTACLWVAGAMWIIELIFRGFKAMTTHDWGYHTKQWLYSGAFLCAVTPAIVPVFIAVRSFFDQLGRWFAVLLAGTNDSEEFIRRALTLSDRGFENFLLVIIQSILLFVLFLWVMVIPFALWISVFFLIIGVSFRYVPGFGTEAFRASLNVTVFAFIGNAVILVIMSAFIGFGRLFYPTDVSAQAWTNTAGMVLAIWAMFKIFTLFKERITATIQGVVDTTASLKDRVQGSGPNTGNRDQIERERERDNARPVPESTKSTVRPQETTKSVDSEESSDQSVDSVHSSSPPPRRRGSSTASRSQRGVTDPEPATQSSPQVTNQRASASASDRAQKVDVLVNVVSTGATLAGHPEVAIVAQAAKEPVKQRIGGGNDDVTS